MTYREEVLAEGVRVILGDCREVLPTLGRFDACVTDPPYGIGESAVKNRTRGLLARPTDYGADAWDAEPAAPETIEWMRQNCRWQIIFGGNYFALPPTSCWLVWDKEINGDFADCELAWTNMPKAIRRLRWMWNGMLRKGREPRFHLTQKPLGVMKWCIEHLPKDAATIIDPYCGSGTTGCAAVALGRQFTGIEKDLRHFDTSCRRISEEISRPQLFSEPATISAGQGAFL